MSQPNTSTDENSYQTVDLATHRRLWRYICAMNCQCGDPVIKIELVYPPWEPDQCFLTHGWCDKHKPDEPPNLHGRLFTVNRNLREQ